MQIQIQALAQLGPHPVTFTTKGQPVQPAPIGGTLRKAYRTTNGHCYVWCEFLEAPGRFEWIRKDHLVRIVI